MGSTPAAVNFATLAVATFAIMVRFAFTHPGLESSSAMLRSPQCFAQNDATRYAFLPEWLNQLNCTINVYFQAAYSDKDARLIITEFGGVFVASTFIMIYESFRPRSAWVVKLASPLLFIGQLITSATSIPIYLALAALAAPDDGKPNTPRGHHAWTTLLAVVGGLLVPSAYLDEVHWSFPALTIWQPFPVYIFALCIILPPILRPIFGRSTPTIPVIIITIICVGISARARLAILLSLEHVSLTDLFLLTNRAPDSLVSAARMLFTLDYVLGFVAIAGQVIRRSSLSGSKASLAIGLAAFSLVGPGAGVVGLWAYDELPELPI